MTHPLAGMTAPQIIKLPGVSDVTPSAARARFALALKHEADGDREGAEKVLADAIAAAS